MSNIPAVKELYAAYARGDMRGILACLSESVAWENTGGPTDVPWLTPRTGHSGVVRFFESLALLQVNSFTPKTYFELDKLVVVLVDEDIVVKATGRRLEERDQVHLWTFDEQGKIMRHRQRIDNHGNWAAFHDQPT